MPNHVLADHIKKLYNFDSVTVFTKLFFLSTVAAEQ